MNHLTHALLAACLGLGVAAAQALEVNGVKYTENIELKGSKLLLNGAGTRYKAVFKVYTAGLYLGKKAASTEEVLRDSGAKRISMTMLRDINAEELGRLFIQGIKDNTPKDDYGRILGDVMRMSQIFSDFKRLKSGDAITLDWVPDTGTVITVQGKTTGDPFKEPEFYDALLRIWLGTSPADWQLKESLLGIAPKQGSL
jgi:hypothetical protein